MKIIKFVNKNVIQKITNLELEIEKRYSLFDYHINFFCIFLKSNFLKIMNLKIISIS